jgi:hypothetical protein
LNKLPPILNEHKTIDAALSGRSIARYGEGELRFACKGWSIKSQSYNPKLAEELKAGMTNSYPEVLACLPRLFKGMPNSSFWAQFAGQPYVQSYGKDTYGSAFISRPDMVHAIDHAEYWDKVRSLWRDKDIVLVGPSPKVLKTPDAKSVTFIKGPSVDAYASIDQIEEEVGRTSLLVMICLGATATALATRLARKGVWAVDAGHLGHFIGCAGAYGLTTSNLISAEYLKLQQEMHSRPEGYGGSGRKQAQRVLNFAKELQVPRILDYGCGRGTLKEALKRLGAKQDIIEYDPAIKGKNILPKPAELVVCTDVLEHIEPDKLDDVLKHLFALCKQAAYFVIATRPANKIMADGRNAHLLVRNPFWWVNKIESVGFKIDQKEIIPDHDLKLWCHKE